MDLFFSISGYILIFLMSLVLIRAIKGPTIIDRLVAVNVIGTKSIVLILIIGIIFGRIDMFVDIAIGYGLLNFMTSIAAAKYFQHQKKKNANSEWEANAVTNEEIK